MYKGLTLVYITAALVQGNKPPVVICTRVHTTQVHLAVLVIPLSTGRSDYFGPVPTKASRLGALCPGGYIYMCSAAHAGLKAREALGQYTVQYEGVRELEGISGEEGLYTALPLALEGRFSLVKRLTDESSEASRMEVALRQRKAAPEIWTERAKEVEGLLDQVCVSVCVCRSSTVDADRGWLKLSVRDWGWGGLVLNEGTNATLRL